jgi:hypothetical protein
MVQFRPPKAWSKPIAAMSKCPLPDDAPCAHTQSVMSIGNRVNDCPQIFATTVPKRSSGNQVGTVYWLKINDEKQGSPDCNRPLSTGDSCIFSLHGRKWLAKLGAIGAASADVTFTPKCP